MLDKLQQDLKDAMKAGDKIKLGVIRMVMAEGKKDQINRGQELNETEWMALFKKGVKTREESLVHFRKSGRDDLIQKEEAEIEILKNYMPQQVSGEALEKIVEDVISALQATSKAQMGQVIKTVMSKHGSQVDGKEVQKIVLDKLK